MWSAAIGKTRAAIEDFTIKNLLARLTKIGDLWAPLLDARNRVRLGEFGNFHELSANEAMPESELLVGPQWHYEPNWDGFRCLEFRDGAQIDLESMSFDPKLVVEVEFDHFRFRHGTKFLR